MRIHCLQHVRHEGPGSIARWARTRGHGLVRSLSGGAEPLPAVSDFDSLVVLGGPMSARDGESPAWMSAETRLIREALEAGRRVFGVCLGAQLLARALGAPVARSPEREIGWFPVRRVAGSAGSPWGALLPEEMAAFHWHEDTFGIPDGAVRLLESDACANQAFDWRGRALGLQCHLEITGDLAQDMVRHGAADLAEGRYVQRADAILWEPGRFDRSNAILDRLLDIFEAPAS